MRVSVVCVVVCLQLVASAFAITITSPDFDVRRVIPGNAMQGITFTPNGDLYMSYDNQYCKYPNAANLPIGDILTAANGTCGTGISSTNIVSSQTGRIYSVHGYEINPTTWAGTRRWIDCGASHGIAVDPRDGAIFVSSVNTGKVWRIPNPDLTTGVYQTHCTNDLYFDLGASGYGGFDAITIAPDGKLYGAGWTSGRFVIVNPSTTVPNKGVLAVANPTQNRAPDGISICVDNGKSFALVAMTQDAISKFDLSDGSYTESTIATNVGGYLDFTAVDPKGCIWGTTIGGSGVYRVTNADHSCGCASAQVPDPPTGDGSCPNCGNIHSVAKPGSSAFSTSFHSSSHCVTVQFV